METTSLSFLNLPFPISLNKLFTQNIYTGKICKTMEARQYREQLAWMLRQRLIDLRKPGFKSWVNVELIFYCPDKRRRDIDNLQKILWDACQDAGVIDDDNHIASIFSEKILPRNGKKNGHFDLHIMLSEVKYYE